MIKKEDTTILVNDSTSAQRLFADEESRWRAVIERDREADEKFYYSVQTTGVYCRPSCGSRLPKRENVRFYESCEQAGEAGFRPCKRCRPNEGSAGGRQRDAVARACRLIEEAGKAPSLSALAEAVGISRFHFHRVFKMVTGVTPGAYAAAQRTKRVRDELMEGASVAEAVYAAGFNSNGPFYASAAEQLGMTPTEFRAGGDGVVIRFAVGECSLGSVLVAASDKGVCSIFLGDDPDALARELQDRFPKAKIDGGDGTFDGWVAKVVAMVEKPALGLDLPLDVRGTAFQLRVWEALRRIPLGSTASYSEIAKQIGMPKAVRAAAAACAANKIAVAIPCHRVVRTDESLSGYRWGVARKAELLERERASIR